MRFWLNLFLFYFIFLMLLQVELFSYFCSNLFLQVFISTIEFCLLILYPAILLNTFISAHGFLVDSLGFFIYESAYIYICSAILFIRSCIQFVSSLLSFAIDSSPMSSC